MISRSVTELAHKQIITDLTIRTLERDRQFIGEFKMRRVFEKWFDIMVLSLRSDLKNVKSGLGKLGAKIQSSKIDGDFTIYTVVEKGRTFDLRYMNIALKNKCEDEIGRLLGIVKGSN